LPKGFRRPICAPCLSNSLTNGGATQGLVDRLVNVHTCAQSERSALWPSFYIAEVLGAGALFEFAGKRHNGGHFVS
jgi:hypothetical protein